MELIVERLPPDRAADWARLRALLWPEMSAADNATETAGYRSGQGPVRLVVAARSGRRVVGFAEISERSIADGCGDAPVAYLEGWFVEPEFRKRGIGIRMITFAADWAREHGYSWLASDSRIDNAQGQRAHRAAGFEEVGRVVVYRKALAPAGR